MREYTLDGRKMDNRQAAFLHIKKELALPDYFGNNLDALKDCLGDMKDVSIRLDYMNAAVNALGEYGLRLISVFEFEAQSRQDFQFYKGKP